MTECVISGMFASHCEYPPRSMTNVTLVMFAELMMRATFGDVVDPCTMMMKTFEHWYLEDWVILVHTQQLDPIEKFRQSDIDSRN